MGTSTQNHYFMHVLIRIYTKSIGFDLDISKIENWCLNSHMYSSILTTTLLDPLATRDASAESSYYGIVVMVLHH